MRWTILLSALGIVVLSFAVGVFVEQGKLRAVSEFSSADAGDSAATATNEPCFVDIDATDSSIEPFIRPSSSRLLATVIAGDETSECDVSVTAETSARPQAVAFLTDADVEIKTVETAAGGGLSAREKTGSDLALLIQGGTARVATGAARAQLEASLAEKPLSNDAYFIICESLEMAPGADGLPGHTIQCVGRVKLTTSVFEASAARLSKVGTRLVLEAGDEGSVRLIRNGAENDRFELSAQRIEFDVCADGIKVGAATVIQRQETPAHERGTAPDL